ncbi:hypothetical protein F4553_003950 [Allocatelliglobosispora scoriae]|uniref:ABC transporter permease n=1 Tax=Allocatelliglobosispora scoriae TaxID=643052 RepID=A0A841BUZ6_9ACTN|nr:hypothetical protein [Allocatelliglobosispora scoriae]MBB5870571.1 hypothetical protein [Allocatelliglobosispora scoriae]
MNQKSLRTAAALAVGLVVVQALLVPLFAAPAANIAPHDVPIAVAGPAAAVDPLAAQLANHDGAFEVTKLADGVAADQAIRDREVYAAFVVTPTGPELHTASAAGPLVASLLTGAAQQMSQGAPVKVVDIVASPVDDPRGAGFSSSYLPLLLTGMLAGILLVLLVSSWVARLVGVAAYALLSGLIGTLVLRDWLGVISGDHLADAATIGLIGLAVSGTLAGLGSLLGRPGIGLGALIVFLVGNPLSAVAAAPELLPQPWGALGQFLPAGAGATLLRSTAFFDGAGGMKSALVLACYAAVGLVFITLRRPKVEAAE